MGTETRLKHEREALGLSRRAVAQASSIGEANYGRIESGRTVPYAPEAERICAALAALGWDGSAAELFEEVDAR